MENPRPLSQPATPPATALHPDDPGRQANTHTARGVALAGRRRFREAIEAFREAVSLVPDNAIGEPTWG